MTQPVETYRHRNTKNSWASKDLIHTFWVGQRVVRSWERTNFIDQIGEAGIVSALPTDNRKTLIVLVEDGPAAEWSPTESIPFRELTDNNRKRLALASKRYSDFLKTLDENGFPIVESV